MKILLAAGNKTSNIATPLASRFASGAVVVNAEKSIDDIIAYIQKGEVFDRAIIVEPAIMGEFGSTNWDYGRSKLVELLDKLGADKDDVQFIFVVTNEYLANIIKEEMFGLGDGRVKVILASAKFKLKFFIQLCTLELSELSDTYDSISTSQTVNEAKTVEAVEEPIHVEAPPEREERVYDTGHEITNEFDEGTSFDESNIEENWGTSVAPDNAGTGEFENPSNSHEESKLSDIETVEEVNSIEPDTVTESNSADFGALGTDEFENPEDSRYNGNGLAEKPEEFNTSTEELSETVKHVDEASTGEFADPENTMYEGNGLAEEPEDTFNNSNETAETYSDAFSNDMYNSEPEPVHEPEPVPEEVPSAEETVNSEQTKHTGSSDYFGGMYGESNGDSILSHLNDTDMQALQSLLASAANRRMSIVITGSKGSGKTTCAYNIAVMIAKLGYSTLYVDLDTETRGVSYLDARVYDWVHTDDDTVSSLAHAIGNSANVISYAGIIMPGLHVLTLGLDQDVKPLDKVGTINRDKIHKFSSMIKENYNFIVYDVPFNQLDGCAVDLVYSADKLIYMADCSTRGLVSMMLDIANVGDDDLRQLIMKKTKIVLNKYYKTIKLFGKNITSASRILAEIDGIIYEVVGDDVADRFEGMKILRTLPLNPEIDNFWLTKKAFVETDNGVKFIGGLLKNILEA